MKSVGALYLGFVGRIDDPVKNGAFYEKIMQAARKQNNRYATLSTGASDNKIDTGESSQNNLNFFYFVSEHDMLTKVRSTMCLLLPSVVDSFGLIAAEAFGINVPFIASKRSGVALFLEQLLENVQTGKIQFPADNHNSSNNTVLISEETSRRNKAKVAQVKDLIDNMICTVDNNDENEWVKKIEWMRKELEQDSLLPKIELLKQIWTDWDSSIRNLCTDLSRLSEHI